MKGIVLYKSKYGHTLQYASWIAKALDFELSDFSKFKRKEIKNYDQIIFATGVYVGKMNQIKKALKWFKEKSIVICACAGNNNIEEEIEKIKAKNLPKEALKFHQFFYLPGGVDFSKVTGLMGKMLKVFRKSLENKKQRTKDEEEMLKGFTEPTYLVDKKYIEPIIEYIKTGKD